MAKDAISLDFSAQGPYFFVEGPTLQGSSELNQ